MTKPRRHPLFFALVLLFWVLCACQGGLSLSVPTPTLMALVTAPPQLQATPTLATTGTLPAVAPSANNTVSSLGISSATPFTTAPAVATESVPPTPLPDTGWVTQQPGMERRFIRHTHESSQGRENLLLIRLDPTLFRFEVGYRPGEPLGLPNWLSETGAVMVVNGGYFTAENIATGLIISEGQASGSSYGPFAGMLAIDASGPQLRWLSDQPYQPQEPLLSGLQSFPVLVKPGGLLGFPDEDGQLARRTVIAQDNNGRIIFIVTASGSSTLHQMSRFLVDSDLEIDIALNLDGGPSSGLLVAEPLDGVPAFSLLPAVILVYGRE